MDKGVLDTFEASLQRCSATPGFLDSFYERFLASSPKVREKFANTDFARQKRALQASLHMMLLAARDEEKGPSGYLDELAVRHSRQQLSIGSELYDYWLDSLIDTVHVCDPRFTPEIEQAWEKVMMVGIKYLLSRY
jgi:hemoglobin-like flavoprotein